MKSRLLIFALLLIAKYSFCQEKDSAGIYVAGTEWNMLSMVAIPCEKFDAGHLPNLKYRHFLHKDTLTMLDSFLKKVKYKRRNNDLDVRAKLVYFKSDKLRTAICMTEIDVMVDGRLIKRNDEFVAFLKRLTPYP